MTSLHQKIILDLEVDKVIAGRVWPIRGQYQGHVITLDQSEAGYYLGVDDVANLHTLGLVETSEAEVYWENTKHQDQGWIFSFLWPTCCPACPPQPPWPADSSKDDNDNNDDGYYVITSSRPPPRGMMPPSIWAPDTRTQTSVRRSDTCNHHCHYHLSTTSGMFVNCVWC